MEHRIFKKIIDQYKDKFSTTTLFGIPISELDAECLRAGVCLLGESELRSMENMKKEREMMQMFASINH